MLPNDPPLRAVRAFEAIARLGGISAAANELMISPSAVSHQLKTLEAFLQMPLTERQGRNLVLRSEGREYYRSIRSAFNVLRQATEHVREQSASRQVTISLIPLFGMGWFIPRLRGFLRENPDIDINVVYANQPPQLPERRRRPVDPLRGRAVDRLSQREADVRQNGAGVQPGIQ